MEKQKLNDLSGILEGDILLVKVHEEYYPIEVKLVTDKNLSHYVVGTDGCGYSLKDLYIENDRA